MRGTLEVRGAGGVQVANQGTMLSLLVGEQMTRRGKLRRRERSRANKVKFLFERIVKDLADLYNKGGMRLGMLWVPKSILNEMTKASIRRLDGMTLPGITGITRTRYGELRILPLDSDKFHAAQFELK